MADAPFVLRHPSGLAVKGDAHPAGRPDAPAVVLCHGFKGFKDWGFFPFVAGRLSEAGFSAVRFNFALNGIDDVPDAFTRLDLFARNTISQELADLDLVLRALCAGGLPGIGRPRAVGLLGHSRGGAVALIRALADPGIPAVAAWASIHDFPGMIPVDPVEWRRLGRIEVPNVRTGQMMPVDYAAWEDYLAHRGEYDFAERLAGLRIPALFVHAAGDAVVPSQASRRLAEEAGSRGRLVEIPGGDHAFGAAHPFQGTTPVLEAALAATIPFFQETLIRKR